MKIKDILKNITDARYKLNVAKRIHSTDCIIKKAISDLNSKNTFEPIKYGINSHNPMGVVFVSTTELQELYGMKPLESLLYIDAITKADASSDKTLLINLLQFLVAGRHCKGPVITQQMLSTIKETQPEIWDEYTAICKKEESEEETSVEESERILNEEI